MNQLSRSVAIMWVFDLCVFFCITYFLYSTFTLPKEYIFIVIGLITITGLISLFLKSNYKIREFNNTFKNAWLLFEGVVFAHVPATAFLYFFVHQSTSVKFLAANIITIFVILKIYRFCFHYYLFNFKKVKKVLIVGNGKNAQIAKDLIENKTALKMEVVDTYFNEEIISHENRSEDNEIDNNKMTQMAKIISEMLNVAHEKGADIIIDAFDETPQKEYSLAALVLLMKCYPVGLKFYSVHDFYEKATGKSIADEYTARSLNSYFIKHRTQPIYDFCKRAYDIIAALIILTVTFPILLYIGIRVKLTDGGSIIYTQNRVGKGLEVFKCYKLRTMYKNDYQPHIEEDNQIYESQDKDDRVIPFCKWVRKARFDEIPQMINILKGEMSIVGPRAEWEEEVKLYSKEIPYYNYRFLVRAGWTGWSHVNQGHFVGNIEDEKERLAYDLYYIKHRNVLWEIGILIKAVFLALGGRHD